VLGIAKVKIAQSFMMLLILKYQTQRNTCASFELYSQRFSKSLNLLDLNECIHEIIDLRLVLRKIQLLVLYQTAGKGGNHSCELAPVFVVLGNHHHFLHVFEGVGFEVLSGNP